MKYSGSDWLEKQLEYARPNMKISELGKNVADLLGELFLGIYHLDRKALYKVDWSNTEYISFNLIWKNLATFDYDELSRLVFLAHHMAVRVNIEAARNKVLKLEFWQRSREGDYYHRHPTLDEAVRNFKSGVTIPEFEEKAKNGKAV